MPGFKAGNRTEHFKQETRIDRLIMSKPFYCCIIIVFLNSYVGPGFGKVCTKVDRPVRMCPRGKWKEVRVAPFTCIDFSTSQRPFEQTYHECKTSHNGSMIQLYNKEYYEWVKQHMGTSVTKQKSKQFDGRYVYGTNKPVKPNKPKKPKQTKLYWIGLMDTNTGKKPPKWTWTTGNELFDPKWANGQPNNIGKERCVVINPETSLLENKECGTSYYIACQKSHAEGPRGIKFYATSEYHREPNIFYAGQQITFVCSAFNPQGGDDLNIIYNSAVNGPPAKKHYVLEYDHEHNICANRTVITQNITSDAKTLTASCFARKANKQESCNPNATKMALCKGISIELKRDGPKSKPVGSYLYAGAPGSVTRGDLVIVNCSHRSGPSGLLTFVVNFRKTRWAISKSVAHMKRYSYGRGNFRVEKASYEFHMKPGMAGMWVSCFSHDIITFRKSSICHKNNTFCTNLPVLRVAKLDISEVSDMSESLKLLLYSLPLLCLISCVLASPIYFCKKGKRQQSQQTQAELASYAPSTGSPAGTLLSMGDTVDTGTGSSVDP